MQHILYHIDIHLVHWNCTSKCQGIFFLSSCWEEGILHPVIQACSCRINDLNQPAGNWSWTATRLSYIPLLFGNSMDCPMYNPRIPTLQSRVCLFLSLAFAGQHHYNLIVKHGPWVWLITHKSTCKSWRNRMLTNHSQHPSCCAWQT